MEAETWTGVTRRMKRPLAVAALILGSLILPACGLTGDLKRPDPLWGDPQDVEAELPEEFSKLLVLTYMAYYSRPEIRALFGVGEHPVHPKGYDVNRETPELMDTLTAPVRARGKVYRDA